MQYVEIKTSELIGNPLDWAVAKCEYPDQTVWIYKGAIWFDPFGVFNPSVNPVQGYPIIEREIGNLYKHNKIDPSQPDTWTAIHYYKTPDGVSVYYEEGPTALIAAMRCYVASKLGDVVKIPQELLQ